MQSFTSFWACFKMYKMKVKPVLMTQCKYTNTVNTFPYIKVQPAIDKTHTMQHFETEKFTQNNALWDTGLVLCEIRALSLFIKNKIFRYLLFNWYRK